MVGGIIPPDIFFGSELLGYFLEGIVVGSGEFTIRYLINKLKLLSKLKRPDKGVSNSLLKIVKKVQDDEKSCEIMAEYSKKFSLSLLKRKVVETHTEEKVKVRKKVKSTKINKKLTREKS